MTSMDDVDLLSGLPGFRDYYPEYWREISYVLSKMRDVSIQYGYEEYEGPSVEAVELIEAKSGEGLIREIFQLRDKSDRRLLLRPEQTPTLARMLAREQQRYKRPIRWFSIPRLFRDETVQKGRVREFWQLNVDILGENRVTADAETIAVAIDIIRACGFEDGEFSFFINHRELLNSFIQSITDFDPGKFISIVDKKIAFVQDHVTKILIDAGISKKDATEGGLLYRRLVNSTGEFRQKLLEDADDQIFELLSQYNEIQKTVLTDQLEAAGLSSEGSTKLYEFVSVNGPPKEFITKMNELSLPETAKIAIEELSELTTYLEGFGVIGPVVYDASMARGLDYYTGIVYEAFDSTGEVVRAILGGGRYENLVEAIGGNPLSGVGFGMGETVILELMRLKDKIPEEISYKPQIYIGPIKKQPIPEVLTLARKLRDNFTVICNPYPWKPAKHIERADEMHATLVLLIGPRDVENNIVSLRVLETAETSTLDNDDTLIKKLSDYFNS